MFFLNRTAELERLDRLVARKNAGLQRFWEDLAAQAWEDLCRGLVPQLSEKDALGAQGPWKPAARWWKGNEPEWDLVSESLDGRRLLLGEIKWSAKPWSAKSLARARADLANRPRPVLPDRYYDHEEVRVLFVPEMEGAEVAGKGPRVVTAGELVHL